MNHTERPSYGQVIVGLSVDGQPLKAGVFNEHEVRAAAGLTMVMAAFAFVSAYLDRAYGPMQVVSIVFVIEFLVRVGLGFQHSPVRQLAHWMTRRRPPDWASARPKRFAWTLGLLMATSMAVMMQAGVRGALPMAICLVCITLMWLESALGLCVGCELHGLLVRRGWARKDPAYEVCAHGACAWPEPQASTGSGLQVVGQHQQVPVLDGSRRRSVNLDNAASTPVLVPVMEAVERFMEWYSSVHRGAGHKSQVATLAYEDARRIVLDFVGADPATHVAIFGKNTTEAINKLAARLDLAANDVVLISQLEHHSNDLPWRSRAQVHRVRADEHGGLDEDHLQALLDEHAGRVRLVAVTGASNVTGHLPSIHRIAARAHAVGARILVDAAQLAPHRAIHLQGLSEATHIDYLALSGHKMYAPFGTGVLIGRRDTFERGAPDQCGGGTVLFVSEDDVAWASAPDRDEAGTPNVVGAVALAAAMQVLRAHGMDRLARHETDLTAHALKRMAAIPGVRIYGRADPASAADRLGVIAFNVERVPHGLVAAILSTEHAIAVRNGCFCAHPYLLALLGQDGVDVGRVRSDLLRGDHRSVPGMVRISFGAYNTHADVDAFADALAVIARGEQAGDYEQDPATGEFRVRGHAPDLRAGFDVFQVSA